MKKTKVKLILAIGLSALLLMGCGSKNSETKNTNANTESQSSKEETKIKLDKENAIVLNDENSYNTVFELFKKQEIKAKKEYLNKTFKVTGTIKEIGKENGFIDIYIEFHSKEHSYSVDTYIEDTEENEANTAKLKKEDIITGYGILEKFDKFQAGANFLRLTNFEIN